MKATELREMTDVELNKQNNHVPANKDSSGFLYPLPYRVAITDSYGYRTHPVTGKKTTWHNGVDLALAQSLNGLKALVVTLYSGSVCFQIRYINVTGSS